MNAAPPDRHRPPPRSPHKHESIRIYGNVIELPKFTLKQRVLWWILLTIARYDWGQALIRRMRGL